MLSDCGQMASDGDKETWGEAKPNGETFAGRRGQEDKRGEALNKETYSGRKRGGATCGAGLRLRGVGKGDVATET